MNDYSAYPPRFETEFKMRYYFNISELIAAGQSIDDVTIEVYYDENKAGYDGPAEYKGPFKYDDGGTYYVEIDWTGRIIYGKREVQFAIIAAQDSNYNSNWDPTNDYSRDGLNFDDFVITEKVPLYIGDELVFGEEPEPAVVDPTPTSDPDNPGTTPSIIFYSLEVEYKSGLTISETNDIRAAIDIKEYRKNTCQSFRSCGTLLVHKRWGIRKRDFHHLMPMLEAAM